MFSTKGLGMAKLLQKPSPFVIVTDHGTTWFLLNQPGTYMYGLSFILTFRQVHFTYSKRHDHTVSHLANHLISASCHAGPSCGRRPDRAVYKEVYW